MTMISEANLEQLRLLRGHGPMTVGWMEEETGRPAARIEYELDAMQGWGTTKSTTAEGVTVYELGADGATILDAADAMEA